MTIYYIDLDNGSDAAAGTSWGTAWKTFTSGATAARIAPGDEIRVSETAAPVSIGTATWTDGKVGNSITFASAPTKQVDTMKSGWVTLGAGSTVTNAQTTAYMTPTVFGGTTMGALQITTSAAANLGYKALGSIQDFSGHQQISFWFRSSTAFDCTGAQNMTITLCSDTAGAVAVDSFVMPKWNYQINTWYPIVIDKGSAAGLAIQSVAIRTTNNTSQTFYFDEMFASPANGLTLWSLIGLNDGYWHAIRTIRGADVQLLAGFQAATAAGATAYLGTVDCSWMGTTTTATTYKLDPSRALLPTTGPGATFGVNITEAGTNALPNLYRGGWNISTGLQTGVTFLDNVTQTTGSIGISFVATPKVLVENFGLVRYILSTTSSGDFVTKDVSMIATIGGVNANVFTMGFPSSIIALGYTNWGWKQFSGNYNIPSYQLGASILTNTVTYTIEHAWGITTNNAGANFTSFVGANIFISKFYPSPNGSGQAMISASCNQSSLSVGEYRMCATNQPSANTISWLAITGNNNNIKINTLKFTHNSNPTTWPGSNNIVTINDMTTTGGWLIGSPGVMNVVYVKNANVTNVWLLASGVQDPRNNKLYFHNYGGAANYFRVYVVDGNTTAGYFELQGSDVYTPGSKAVRFNSSSFLTNGVGLGTTYDLRLGSAAAEANKLVTVTARVKRNSTDVVAGIYIPGFNEMVPGYSSDITQVCTSTGTYELLTITFTPTEDCVFDVFAFFNPMVPVSPDVIWDALTIDQAA